MDARSEIRGAQPSDAVAMKECVESAYRHYISRMGKSPGPMLDDYSIVTQQHTAFVQLALKIKHSHRVTGQFHVTLRFHRTQLPGGGFQSDSQAGQFTEHRIRRLRIGIEDSAHTGIESRLVTTLAAGCQLHQPGRLEDTGECNREMTDISFHVVRSMIPPPRHSAPS